MKAICGFIHLDGAPADLDALAAMHGALCGRGVAQAQSWQSEAVALAGTTWWPVDDGVFDPVLHMDTESGCVVVADALLLDRADLRAALGCRVATDATDAGLIAQAWLRWGEDCAAHLNGDFAFVVWDRRRSCLYAARDGVGARPLCFHHARGRLFAFASDANAVAAFPSVGHEIDERRIADFLLDDELSDIESTFFAGVRRLRPAHYLLVDASGASSVRYWTPDCFAVRDLPHGDASWADAVRQRLVKAVERHLERGRAFGSMVSGGLDSSSVAAIARALLADRGGGSLPVFSAINSIDPTCVETRAIRVMLAEPGFNANLADVADLSDLESDIERALVEGADPFDASMSMLHAMYLLAARRGVGAVFDGINADAAFSGGGYMTRLLRSGRWCTAWREARGMQEFYGPWLPAWKTILSAAPGAAVPEFVKRPLRGTRGRRARRREIAASLLAQDFARRVLPDEREPSVMTADAPLPKSPELRDRLSSRLFHGTVIGLERYRRVASRHGIEPRHPFLDRDLLDLCLHLPDRQGQRDGWPKAVLRHAMAAYLPPAVCWRRGKEHLGFAFNRRLFDRDGRRLERLWDERSRLQPWVDPALLGRCIARYRAGAIDDCADSLLHVDALSSWLRGWRR